MTCRPGIFCDHSETCLRTECEGHPENLRWPTRRVDTGFALTDSRFNRDDEPKDEPVATAESTQVSVLWLLLIVAVTLAAIAAYLWTVPPELRFY